MSAHGPEQDADLAEHGDTHGHGSLRGYLVGFGLAVVLTAVPFALVMTGALSVTATSLLIFGLAVVQIVVHVVFFLHLDTRSEGGWTLVSFAFTAVIVFIVVAGSVWVMYHLNTNMMPMPMKGAHGAP